jgi:hypothetical protein
MAALVDDRAEFNADTERLADSTSPSTALEQQECKDEAGDVESKVGHNALSWGRQPWLPMHLLRTHLLFCTVICHADI